MCYQRGETLSGVSAARVRSTLQHGAHLMERVPLAGLQIKLETTESSHDVRVAKARENRPFDTTAERRRPFELEAEERNEFMRHRHLGAYVGGRCITSCAQLGTVLKRKTKALQLSVAIPRQR